MSSDTKRYGSSFGRPSSSGASSFGFEPAANPLRASGFSDPNQGPKVYSGESFEEPTAVDPSPTPGFDQVDGYDGYQDDSQASDADYDDNGYDGTSTGDDAPQSSFRDRLATRFGESLSFRRARSDQQDVQADEAPEQGYEEFGTESYGDQGYSDQSYSDQSYTDQGYTDQSYSDQGYSDQGYGDQSYTDQSYTDQGYTDTGYQSSDYSDQGYGDQGYGDQGFDNFQDPAAGAAPTKERGASGWRSRFANRTAGLAGQDAGNDFQDAGYAAGGSDYGYGSSGYADQGFGAEPSPGGQTFGGQTFGGQTFGGSDYGSGFADTGYSDYNQASAKGFGDPGQNEFGQDDFGQTDYGQDDYGQGVDPYGTGGKNRGALAAPGLKRGFLSGFKLDLGSKWLMPAASIAGGVLVLAVLLYLFNPFAGNPLESPESIAAVETMLAGLDIDPGPQDGIADEAYRLAIVEFQEMHGLSQTGELTPEVFQEMTAIYELSNL